MGGMPQLNSLLTVIFTGPRLFEGYIWLVTGQHKDSVSQVQFIQLAKEQDGYCRVQKGKDYDTINRL
ncbi:MAG: hypothetical protein A2078_05860 [Nitrospirae bacterium GWC2_57_9]|nr:MAG: hypothetical protein A2078_05860 [Nitrospirae bacterium GWC2_57_9]